MPSPCHQQPVREGVCTLNETRSVGPLHSGGPVKCQPEVDFAIKMTPSLEALDKFGRKPF